MKFKFFPLILLVCVGCASSQQNLRTATQHYSDLVQQMDHASIAAMYTKDGVNEIVGGPTVSGRDAILKHLQSFKEYHVQSNQLTADSIEVNGSKGTVKGRYHQRVQIPSGEVVNVHGNYVALWVRENHQWFIKKMTTIPEK